MIAHILPRQRLSGEEISLHCYGFPSSGVLHASLSVSLGGGGTVRSTPDTFCFKLQMKIRKRDRHGSEKRGVLHLVCYETFVKFRF